MKKRSLVAVVVVLLIGVIYLISRPDLPEVRLVKISFGLVEKTVSNTRAGSVNACLRSKLSLPIGGQIAQLYVREGDRVEKGQLLMSLWNSDRQAQVEYASAQVQSASKEHQGICIASSSDALEAKRLSRLFEQQLVSAERADMAAAKSKSSEAACAAADARKAQSLASLKLAEAILAQTYLSAPFAGRVAEVTGEVGEFSTPSPPGVPTPPAIDLLTDNCHYISAPIDEVDASEIAVGMPVRVTMDSFRDRDFPATIRRISTYVMDFEKQARTVEVEADLLPDSNMPRLLAGCSADMEIILEAKRNSLRVPTELIVDEKFVLLVDDNNLIQQREIEIGLANWHFSEVLSGLDDGDLIVSNIGVKGVVAGAEVVVAK
jgi:HlyD family secretion protein